MLTTPTENIGKKILVPKIKVPKLYWGPKNLKIKKIISKMKTVQKIWIQKDFG